MRRRKLVFVLFQTVLCLALVAGFAAEADAHGVFGQEWELRQPDGVMVTARIWGDEFYQVVESLDGFTLMRDPETCEIVYARLSGDGNRLESTGIRVETAGGESLGLEKHIRINPDAMRSMVNEARTRHQENLRAVLARTGASPLTVDPPCNGDVKGICIIVDFPDQEATVSRDEVHDYCNQIGYSNNGNNGSVRDYYHDVSEGNLTYTNWVMTDYYRAPNDFTWYDDCSVPWLQRAVLLIKEILNSLDPAVDFSQYDSNSDGLIDAINVYYAGRTGCGWAKGMWPGCGGISWTSADGVSAYKFQITGIGDFPTLATFCHENGHMIGFWPDLYDYGRDGAGHSRGVGQFCIMCSYTSHTNPEEPCAYLKDIAGWTSTTVLGGYQADIPVPVSSTNTVYRINHPSLGNEYYLIENRHKSGRDVDLPDEGLAVWHIDTDGNNSWNHMTPDSHYVVTLVQADGLWEMEHNQSSGDEEDLWSSPDYTMFSPCATPLPTWWDGSTADIFVTNIDEPSPTMHFTFSPANSAPTAVTEAYTADGDGDCCMMVAVSDVDGGSTDPEYNIVSRKITAVDGSPISPADEVQICGSGSHQVTLTVTDECGLSHSAPAQVQVEDVTPPELVCAEMDTALCGEPIVFTEPEVTDNCDPAPQLEIVSTEVVDGPGQAEHTHTRCWKATDASDNPSEVCCQSVLEEACDNDFVYLDIPDSILVAPGEDIAVPVEVMDVTGWGIMAFDMRICWCSLPLGLLEYTQCSPGEVMTGSGWQHMNCNQCEDHCVSVAAAGPGPLLGEGVLFYLEFHVSDNAKPCMCCEIMFDEINIYDPEIPLFYRADDGDVCVDWCRVSGCAHYWKCCRDECGDLYYPEALAGLEVHLSDSCRPTNQATLITGQDGCYSFDCLLPPGEDCSYDVSVEYCRLLDCVDAFDAVLVLRHLLCGEPLDECAFPYDGGMVHPQMVAADVTCTSGITSYDASLILQYTVGLIPTFPCADPWVFYPVGPEGAEVHTCPGVVDWVGVFKGDVDGCFRCLPPPVLLGDPVLVSLGAPVDLGDAIQIPVMVEGAYDIFSTEFEMAYDAGDLEVDSAEPSGLAEGSLSAFNPGAGNLVVAMAAANSYGGDGEIALVTFNKLIPEANSSSVHLTSVLFNRGDPEAEIGSSAGITTVEARTFLGPVVPNPFTRGTTIGYHLSSPATVSLEVYDVEGKLVRSLFRGPAESGRNAVLWDGRDTYGRPVAEGVYFCRMETDGFGSTIKIVHMR
jgi:M6 family metalloprotease-like protein